MQGLLFHGILRQGLVLLQGRLLHGIFLRDQVHDGEHIAREPIIVRHHVQHLDDLLRPTLAADLHGRTPEVDLNRDPLLRHVNCDHGAVIVHHQVVTDWDSLGHHHVVVVTDCHLAHHHVVVVTDCDAIVASWAILGHLRCLFCNWLLFPFCLQSSRLDWLRPPLGIYIYIYINAEDRTRF